MQEEQRRARVIIKKDAVLFCGPESRLQVILGPCTALICLHSVIVLSLGSTPALLPLAINHDSFSQKYF